MKKYTVEKETFDYITSLLADEPSSLLHEWNNWLDGTSGGTIGYRAMRELNSFPSVTASVVVAQLLQGTAELELKERKYRIYHKQNSGVMSFAYHYFTKSGTLQDSDDFDDVSVLTESNVKALADYEGKWVWEWAHEVKDND